MVAFRRPTTILTNLDALAHLGDLSSDTFPTEHRCGTVFGPRDVQSVLWGVWGLTNLTRPPAAGPEVQIGR